ncbi:MAG: hypothetical protein ACI9J3_003274 [Parvicellaceae bacterium]
MKRKAGRKPRPSFSTLEYNLNYYKIDMKRKGLRMISLFLMRGSQFLLIMLIGSTAFSKPPILNKKEMRTHPPRVTRTCCAFGSNLKIAVIPFAHMNTAIEFSELGRHQYLGGNKEGNGILYTTKGGFIDLGHLREWADWTAFLYLYIQDTSITINYLKSLGVEGGKKSLILRDTDSLSTDDRLLLAGRIAFELSHWHEIATGYGVSAAPFISEKFSSFSPEDMYSNMLGINLAIKAIKSNLSYDDALTNLLNRKLVELDVVDSIEATYEALDQVENIWWSKEYSVPNKKIMLKRSYLESACIKPWLVPNASNPTSYAELDVPVCSNDGTEFCQFFTLNIKVNHKIPIKKALPNHHGKTISQSDFDLLIQYVRVDLTKIEVKAAMKSRSKRGKVKA